MLRGKCHPGAVTYTTESGKRITVTPSRYIPRYYRVATYSRVSTNHDDQLDSLQAQVEYYRTYVNRRCDWILVREYIDVKSARSIYAREQFNKMIEDCMAGNIDIIVTKSISRFARKTIDTLSVLKQLKEKNVDVFFVNENLHSLDSENEFILSVIEAVAQEESAARSRNIKWGILRQAQNADAPIYSRPCYGYRKSSDGNLIKHDEEARNIQLIYDLYLSGLSILAIGRELERRQIKTPTGKDRWSKRALETILANEKYTGDVVLYKTYCDEYPSNKRIMNQGSQDQYVVEDHHIGIISKKQYEEVQAEKKRRTNVERNENGDVVRKKTHYSAKAAINECSSRADMCTEEE